ERELLVWMHDPNAAAIARRFGADRRFAPVEGSDLLSVIDTDLSMSKTGPYIEKRIRYDVWLNARGVAERGRVTVSYGSRLTPQQARAPRRRVSGYEWDPGRRELHGIPGFLGSYTRLYVPPGGRVVEAVPQSPPATLGQDAGFTTIERWVRAPAGERTS